jgi:hypothetical protein
LALLQGRFRKIAFIVSSGRTGTTALAAHLDRIYPDVRALHEPAPSWRLRRASNRALCGRLSRADLAALLAASRRRLIERLDRPLYVESNPFLVGFIEALGDVFAEPLVVHIVRDPRTYVRSSINFGTFAGLKRWAQALVPDWLPKPHHCATPTGLDWSAMSPPARLAWYWQIANTCLNRGREIYGDRYLRLRFEDLFAPDGSGLRQLTDFLGIAYDDRLAQSAQTERVNASTTQRLGRWQDWDARTKEDVLQFCRPLMRQYGYTEGLDTAPRGSNPTAVTA